MIHEKGKDEKLVEKSMDKLSVNELEDVTGGGTHVYLVDSEGHYEAWAECNYCGYAEIVDRGSMKIDVTIEDTFVCKKCGFTRRWVLRSNGRDTVSIRFV